MSVDEVKQLLDLLNATPEVNELSIKGASGGKVTLKRLAAAPNVLPSEVSVIHEAVVVSEDDSEGEVSEPIISAVPVNATMVGLFHGANPVLSSGDNVVVGQIVGYIESMRLMNEVVSTIGGKIEAVQVSENQPVQYGQPLFSISAL